MSLGDYGLACGPVHSHQGERDVRAPHPVTDGDAKRSLKESKVTESRPDTSPAPEPCSEPLWPVDTTADRQNS